MRTGQGVRTIAIGGVVKFDLKWSNQTTGVPEDLAGLTATVELTNIDEEFKSEPTKVISNAIEVEPNDIEGNPRKGLISITLSSEDTNFLKIPGKEPDPYLESDYYSIMVIKFDDGRIGAIYKIKPLKTSR